GWGAAPAGGPDLLQGSGRLPTELHICRPRAGLVLAVELDLQAVAGLLLGDDVAQAVAGGDVYPVRLDDQVAAEHVALARDHDLRRPAAQAGLLGAAAAGHALDEQAVVRREVEELRDAGIDGAHDDAEVRMIDAPLGLQLCDHVADGIDRNREPDADVALGSGVTRGDRRADADHLALRVQQRAAR